ncbi:MAG: hypothetical protein MUC81_00955 [Bacteroidia bacterium]|jgi:hypothetical protein|nr:hypothetical protein [Bacteroidia bacterium]
MKQQIDAIKKTLETEGFSPKLVEQLKSLREWFKANRNEPGYVKMIRLAYENIEEYGDYSYLYLEEEDGVANLSYLLDLLGDYDNKYNKEELQDIKNLMLGIEPEPEVE